MEWRVRLERIFGSFVGASLSIPWTVSRYSIPPIDVSIGMLAFRFREHGRCLDVRSLGLSTPYDTMSVRAAPRSQPQQAESDQ